MITAVAEVERKYEAPEAGPLPELLSCLGVATPSTVEHTTLEAVYHDTADLRLARDGITLRARRGGADAGWHLKVPAGADSRTEFRLPPTADTDAVPPELAELVLARTRGAALSRVAVIRTERTSSWLVDTDGSRLVEVVLDQVTGQAVDADPVRWTELEVELVDGGVELLDAIENRLTELGIRRCDARAKLHRVLGARVPTRPRRDQVDRRASAGEAMLAYLDRQREAMARWDLGIRTDTPEAVHQMRVSVRRLRSALTVYRELFAVPLAGLRDELGWLGNELGPARDTEVQWALLRGELTQLHGRHRALPVRSAGERLDRHMSATSQQAARSATAALSGPRYLALLDAIDALVDRPPFAPLAARPARLVLPKLHHRVVATVASRLRAVRASAPGPDRDAAVHRVRKAGKRARYGAEVMAVVAPRRTAEFLASSAELQSLLGNYNDAVVARGVLEQLGDGADGGQAEVYGVLRHRLARSARQQAQALRRTWRATERAADRLAGHADPQHRSHHRSHHRRHHERRHRA